MSYMHELAVELVWGSRENKEFLRRRGQWRGEPHIEWHCPRCGRKGIAAPTATFTRCAFDDAELEMIRRAG